MTTYKEIIEHVKKNYGKTMKTCWIAHVKDSYGLTKRRALNRKGDERAEPCPDKYWLWIEDALRYHEMI